MDADAARQHLESDHDRLARLAGLPATGDAEPDPSSLADVEAELADVEAALRRLDDGTYGTCETCGAPLDDDQLVEHPAARSCPAHLT